MLPSGLIIAPVECTTVLPPTSTTGAVVAKSSAVIPKEDCLVGEGCFTPFKIAITSPV